jgi:protein-S-isoprenylcysteine O-methyltransferase Ste14
MIMMDRADVKVMPPFVLLGFLGLELLVAVLAPMRALPAPVALPRGIGVTAGSVVVLLLAVREIAHAKAAFDVSRPTTKIIASGVFHVTRNPVYLSMILLVIGIGLILNSPCSILLAAPMDSLLCLTIIRPEERYLEDKFGDIYRAYRSRTPRWLSARRLFDAIPAGRLR